MGTPIVFISRWRLAADRAAWSAAWTDATEAIAAGKPRTAVFASYLDEPGAEIRIVHVFPDAAAVAEHFDGASERAASVADLLVPLGFELFGSAPGGVIAQLRRDAAASGVAIERFPDGIGGFLRAPA
jgi:hypothetical protein